jgi:pyruvate decarboxylase
MYKGVTVAMAELHDEKTASGEIDRVLRECLLQSRPVYIELPTDMVGVEVDGKQLETPIDLSVAENEKSAEESVVTKILEKMYKAKQPLIIVDGFASRYGYREEAQEFVKVTGWPTTVPPFGKSAIDETSANFHGTYAGVSKDPEFRSWVQSCDLVLRLGPMDADTNTYGFSTIPDSKVAINFHRDDIDIDGSLVENIHVKHLLRSLLKQLDPSKLPRYNGHESLPNPTKLRDSLKPYAAKDLISQDTFWQRISSYFQSGDIILTETGTASYGSAEFILPPDTTLIVSSIWLSIGYMLGSCAGSSLALRDMIKDGQKSRGRTVLFEGDGSFQMTAQTISDIFRNRLDVVIFLLNNDGYTIERLIHGMEETYNNIHPWNYLEAPNYFGAPKDDPSYPVTTRRATNWGELVEILSDKTFKDGKGFNMVEVMMTKEDGPDTLKQLCSFVARRNSKVDEAVPLD